jgi:hypothetical protein
LKRRRYNDKVIESGFSKASEINRNDLLEYKEKKINKRVPLIFTYHPSLEKISGIVRHHWKEIEKRETLAKLFPEPPVVAFRRPKSIKDTLVRAAVSRSSSTVGQCKPCGDKRRKYCLQLQCAQVFHSKTTGKEYKIFCNVNCKTPNGWFREQLGQRFTFLNFFPMMTDNQAKTRRFTPSFEETGI